MSAKRNISLLLFFFLVFAFLAEASFRAVFKLTGRNIRIYREFSFERYPSIFMPDDRVGYRLIPGSSGNALTSEYRVIYSINDLGLREKELKGTSKFKVLFLGDSFTFGDGLPYGKRFSDILEKKLSGIYSINAGVPGYGINQMYGWLKAEGLSLEPDLVVCSIVEVDLDRVLYRNFREAAHLLERNKKEALLEPREKRLISFWVAANKWAVEHSYLYAFSRVRLKILLMSSHIRERDRRMLEDIRLRGEGGYKIEGEEQKAQVIRESSKVFFKFKELLVSANTDFLVVNISSNPIPWLEAFLRQEGLEYLDVSGALRKASGIRFELDGHYNEKGNRIIAESLEEYLVKRYPKVCR